VLGPIYEFAGVNKDPAAPPLGFVKYLANDPNSVRIDYPTPVLPVAVASLTSSASFLGKPAYEVTLATAAFSEADRYVQYQGELLNNANSVLAGFRILSHTDRVILLDPVAGALPTSATKFQVRAKFFKIVTNGSEGLGPVLPGPQPVPLANVRIGFAFHNDPQAGLGGRFPTDEQEFLYDLENPAFLAWIAQGGGQPNPGGVNRNPRYVQWDVLFDLSYAGLGLSPTTPRPELRFLRLPFRF